jgi:putative MATE family efflux protein
MNESEDSSFKEENKMGIVPIPRLLFFMSLPAIISMLIQAMYNIVDSIFVAQIGEGALTAISLAFPIQILIISCFVGMGVGINSVISRRLGEGKKEEAENASKHGFIIAIFLWLIVGIIGIIFSESFIGLFTNHADIIQQGRDYLLIVTIFSIGSMITQAAFATLQGSGEMIKPMIGQIIGAVSNIILDPILIYGLLGFPKMGVTGAAIATVIGQGIAMCFIVWVLFFGKDNKLTINYKNFKYNSAIIKDIIVVGLPAAIMQGLGSLMVTGYNFILAFYGMSAVAVFGVYFKVQSFIFMPIFGLGQGAMPIYGYNFGAKKQERFTETLKVAIVTSVLIMGLGTLIFWIFPEQLLMLFNPSEEMLSIGIHCFRSVSIAFPLAGISIMLSVCFQAMGKAYVGMISSFIRQMIVLLPSSYILAKIGGLDLVWYGFIISEIACLLYEYYMYRRFKHEILDGWKVHSVKV